MAVEDSEDLQVQAEASTASSYLCAQVTVCESLCCVDHTEPYQPTSSDISFEKLHQELVTLIRQALPTVIKVTSIHTISVKL